MSEYGECLLSLLDADSKPWRGEAFIRIENDRERVVFEKRRIFTGPIRFQKLRTVPRGPYLFHVKTEHHVPVTCLKNVFSKKHNEVVMNLLVHYRVADSYGPFIRYPAFADLEAARLTAVEKVLLNGPDQPNLRFEKPEDSREYTIRDVPGREYYEGFVKNKAKDRNHRLLGCLLNLYAKMSQTDIPGPRNIKAWEFVHSIFCLRQDRLFATVNPELDMPAYIKALDESDDFDKPGSGSHDIPSPEGYEKSEHTYKSKDKKGNLQLTFASKDLGGRKHEWVLDADIDEKTGIAHVWECCYHLLTGAKTNPYAVHQLLALDGYRPRYDLVVPVPASSMVA